MKKVVIYTDGACEKNKQGGWGVVLVYRHHIKQLSGGNTKTTCNRMELTSVIQGIEALKEPCDITIASDSSYVVDAFNKGWIKHWINDLFVHTANSDLWKQLLEAIKIHNVKFIKIKAHSGNVYNEMCDKLAKNESRRQNDKNYNTDG